MMMELSGRISLLCLLFGLATGFPAVEQSDFFSSPDSAPSPRGWGKPPQDKTVSFPVHSQTGVSSSGGTGLGVSSSGGTGLGVFSGGSGGSRFSLGGGGSKFSSGSGSFFTDSSGATSSAGSGVGSGGFSAGLGFATGIFAQLLALGSNLVRARPLSLGQAWSNLQGAFGSVWARPLYASSYVVHSNRGYKRERDSRTDAKYVTDAFGQISPPVIQNGGTGSKGQQVY